MDCAKFDDTVSLYIDDMLTDEQCENVKNHISSCEKCRDTHEALKKIVIASNNIEEADVPAGFKDDVMRKVRAIDSDSKIVRQVEMNHKAKKKMSYKSIALLGSAACLALVCGVLLFSGLGMRAGAPSYTEEAAYDMSAQPAAEPPAPAEAPATEIPMMAEPEMAEMQMADYGGELVENGDMMQKSDASAQVSGVSGDEMASVQTAAAGSGLSGGIAQSEQKIILSAYYDMQVTDFDKTVELIKQYATASGGYIENFSSSIYSSLTTEKGIRDLKNGSISIRVPSDKYSQTIEKIESFGKVTFTQENAENITSQYVDTAARLEVKKVEEKRLLDLLGKATEIEDLISLETRLSYVRADIESMESLIKNWDKSVRYSTITIGMTEIDNTKIDDLDPTLSEQIAEGFRASINSLIHSVEYFLIVIARNIMGLIIFGVLVIILIAVTRYFIKKRRD